MKEQNSTQKFNKPENQWIVLSQICIAWQGTAILEVKKNSSFPPYCCGITKPQNFGKTSTRSESHPGKNYKVSETKRDSETTTKHSCWQIQFYSRGEGEETSKRNHKTSLKTEKPSNSSKDKNPDQKCQSALEICTHRKHVLQGSPGVTSVQKLVIGCKLVKVHNQENYLKLLKKNLSSDPRRNRGC